jgi:hypothetical protein
MTFVVDIDQTIFLYPNNEIEYEYAVPNVSEIDIINKLYDCGHVIIMHTGRNWDKYEYTVKQLEDFDVNYDQLVMGKPQGIYIDRDSYKSIKEINHDFKLFN